MAEEAAETAKNKTLKTVALAFTGLLTCVLGIVAGRMLSEPPAPDPRQTTATPGENPQTQSAVVSENPFDTSDTSATSEATSAFAENPTPVLGTSPISEAFGSEPSAVSARASHMALADEELRAGNFARATRTYSALQDLAQGVEEAALRFRLALCAEAEGNVSDALLQYQQLAVKFPMLSWVSVARLGEARCFAALGQLNGLAEGTLRQALLDQTTFSPRIRGELFHLSGRACCQSFLKTDVNAVLDDNELLMPRWITDPNRELDLLPLLLKEARGVAGPVGFEILQQTDRLPNSIFIRASTPVSDLKLLIEAVCKRSQFAVEFSESCLLALSRRTQQLHVDDISLGLLLDGLTTPFGMLWWHDDDGIHIRTVEEVEKRQLVDFRQHHGERLLTSALVMNPDSRQAGYSRLALGILQNRRGNLVDAAYTFRMQMELDPRSEVEAEASLNLGKCRLKLGQYSEAREAFLVAVDSASHHMEARVAAYLYFGRLQVEDGAFQPAVSSLVRALALCRGTKFEGQAALMLASAYLLNGSPQGASSVLMERREALDTAETRSAAAFLSALAQFRAAVLAPPRERAARQLVTALTRFNTDQEFGPHWAFLKAQAYEEVGLSAESTDELIRTIKQLPPAPLRDRAMLLLANHYRSVNRLEDAATLLASVSGDREAKFGEQIAMQAALVALKQGHPETAVQQCRYIVEKTDDEALQRSALKTMGQAFEMQRDYKSAVYCFAGMLPASLSNAAAPVSPLPTGKTSIDGESQ